MKSRIERVVVRTMVGVWIVGVGITTTMAAASETIAITVDAGEFDRQETVLRVRLPSELRIVDQRSLIRVEDQQPITSQIVPIGDNRILVFALDKPLRAGKGRVFHYGVSSENHSTQQSAPTASSSIAIREDDGVLIAMYGDKEVLRYNVATVESPDGVDSLYRRSGYIHPVRSPSGRVITGDFAPDHPHQHGLFNAFVRSEVNGRRVDFWNQAKKTGRIEHRKIVQPPSSGPVIGSFVVGLRHSALLPKGDPLPVIDETWRVDVFGGVNGFLFDIDSKQNVVIEKPLKLRKYHYGGMALRCNAIWESKGSQMLTSEGKTREDGNATSARWVAIYGQIDGNPCGMAVFCHPDNFRAPQTVRLHPAKPYFCFAPMADGEFSLSQKKPYRQQYRYYVFDGSIDASNLNRLWNDYAHPPVGSASMLDR